MRLIHNEDHFFGLLKDLKSRFGFPENTDTQEAVATVILHAPPDMGEFDPEYVGQRVSKMMANKVAFDKIQELKEKRNKQAETNTEVSANGTIQDKEV